MSTYTVTVNDPGHLASATVAANLANYAGQDWQMWAAKIAVPDVNIVINVTNTATQTAAAGDITFPDTSKVGLLAISINVTNYWLKYINQSSDYHAGDPLNGLDSPLYTFLHEEGHALGINAGGMAPYLNAGFYYGAHAMAAYNNQLVPITQDGYNGHLGHTLADGVAYDVMSGIAPNRSFVQGVSDVDVGIIWDGGKYLPVGVHANTGINHELVELYFTEFNRSPDAPGLTYWNNQLKIGMTMTQVMASFDVQPETAATYPPGTTPEQFVTTIFNNAFGHAPDAAGLEYYVHALAHGDMTRSNAVQAIIEGAQPAEQQAMETKVQGILDHILL